MTNQDVQKRCQAQIDKVVGSGRLPEAADRGSLPLIECVMKETFRSGMWQLGIRAVCADVPILARWHPAIPLAIPHYATADDEYQGMRIPAGATVLANLRWAVFAVVQGVAQFFSPEP